MTAAEAARAIPRLEEQAERYEAAGEELMALIKRAESAQMQRIVLREWGRNV